MAQWPYVNSLYVLLLEYLFLVPDDFLLIFVFVYCLSVCIIFSSSHFFKSCTVSILFFHLLFIFLIFSFKVLCLYSVLCLTIISGTIFLYSLHYSFVLPCFGYPPCLLSLIYLLCTQTYQLVPTTLQLSIKDLQPTMSSNSFLL